MKTNKRILVGALLPAAITILLLTALLFTGCSPSPKTSPPPAPSLVNTVQPNSTTQNDILAPALALVNTERSRFNEVPTDSITIYHLQSTEVYISAVIGGGQLITVREPETDNVYTTQVPFTSILYFEDTAQDKTLMFSTDGSVLTPDQTYRSNAEYIYLRYDTQEIVRIEYSQIWYQRQLGVLYSKADEHRFADDCEVSGNKIIFRMQVFPDMPGTAYAGTEITLNQIPHDPSGGGLYSIGFRNTPLTWSNEFIATMQQLQGIKSIETNYIESQVYSGTELLLQCEEGYHLTYFFNTDGDLAEFKDFYITVERNQ